MKKQLSNLVPEIEKVLFDDRKDSEKFMLTLDQSFGIEFFTHEETLLHKEPIIYLEISGIIIDENITLTQLLPQLDILNKLESID